MIRFRLTFLSLLWMAARCSAGEPQVPLRGIVRDATGAAVPHAEVEIRHAGGTALATRQAGTDGKFEWLEAPPGLLRLRVASDGFAVRERLIDPSQRRDEVVVVLEPALVYERVTVNATRGAAEEAELSPHLAVALERREMEKMPLATLGEALQDLPGILVQQSTYAQVSPTLRGLTGYHVLNLIDGVRLNNSMYRSGPNQYLAFLEPAQAERVEALLGPTGAQYGSDSLGGTIQVSTPAPRFSEKAGPQVRGELWLSGASADLSTQASGRLAVSGTKLFWLGSLSGRKHNDLRAGRGFDSRNVFHKLFGLPLSQVRDLTGGRQRETAFSQSGAQTKFAARPRPDQLVTAYFLRGEQHGVKGYKDLLGGLGRTISAFEPQVLNWFHGRYERFGWAGLDSLSSTFSINSQTDGGVRQNLRFTDPVTRDHNRVRAYGYTAQATAHRGARWVTAFGGDLYDERVRSQRRVYDPATGAETRRRPLYPDGSSYLTIGGFGQGSWEATRSLRAAGGFRLTGVRFRTVAQPAFGIPDSSQRFSDVTFHSSLRWQASGNVGLHGVVSRGFRAPNLNDLGAVGLNDLGYEVPAAEAIRAGALLSTEAGETAVSKGAPVKPLRAESLMNYEFGARFTSRRLYVRAQVFDAELHDPIVRRTLLFAASSVPEELAGQRVTPLRPTAQQAAQGVTAVATAMDPRAVKAFANDGRSRYYGIETVARWRWSRPWTLEASYSYLAGRDLEPNRNIRRLTPQMGSAALRYSPSKPKIWVEASVSAAGKQSRLSGGDRDDERIGAAFRRKDIEDFFHGSRVAALVQGGVFLPTGETLAQIQDRVLPLGAVVRGVRVADDATRAPLYTSTAGWAVVNVRAGLPVGRRWRMAAAVENLFDRNYRIHGSGIDAPGISAYAGVGVTF